MFKPLSSIKLNGIALFSSTADWIARVGLGAPVYPDQPAKFWGDMSAINGGPGYMPTYFDGYLGQTKPGYLVVASSLKGDPFRARFIDEAVNHDGIVTRIKQIELVARPFLASNQSRFYIEYSGHPDFSSGIPYLAPMGYQGASWAGSFNLRDDGSPQIPFPVSLIDTKAMRINAITGEVEVFEIEEYRRAFKPTVGGALSDEELCDKAAQVLFNGALSKAQRGAEIRRLAR